MSDADDLRPRPNPIIDAPATVEACAGDYSAAQDRKATEAAHAFGISVDLTTPEDD